MADGEYTTYKHWKHRKPPNGILENHLTKCILPQPCVFKDACLNAHSDGELQEWKERLQLENKSDGYVEQATFSIQDHRSLINEKLSKLEEGESENNIISELIGGCSVIADENLFIMHVDKDKDLAWVFTVTCLKTSPCQVLERVFLMNESKEFSISYVFYSKDDNIKPLRLPDNCQLLENAHKNKNLAVIKILLRFYSNKYGLFHQDVVFDFGGFPKLVRKMGVQVASEEFLSQTMKYDPQIYGNNELTWMEKYDIIELDGSKNAGLGNILYPLPPNIENLVVYGAFKHLDSKLSKQNYRQRLHTLLFIEEYQRRADLQSVSLHLDDFSCCLDTIDIDKCSKETATVVLDDYMMEYLAKLVGRSGKALVRINTYEKDGCIITDPIVYRVVIKAMESESFVLELGDTFLSLLHSSSIAVDVDICFCLVDIFQILHNAVENVDLSLTFPDLSMQKCLPYPVQDISDEQLSKNQIKAMNIVLNPAQKPPILLLGPFGAGKTRTIAKIINKLMSNNGNRSKHILLCTQSNSAADHYIEEYFHPLHILSASGEVADSWKAPLRINWEHRFVESVSDKVLTYCLLNKTTGMFQIATKEDLDKHALIISTLMTSSDFYKLGLPADYFSHIFIDEAAQAMEAEALVPLLFAEKKTRILLAGDHMQMCTPLSSNVAKSLGLGKSLLERLFEYYPFDADCKLKLLENFRSYKEIVDLSSHLFYEDSLLSNKFKVDLEQYPVEFYGVDGLEMLSKSNPSYKNDVEATEVLIRLTDIQLFWENRDVTLDLSKVCVTSFYPAQVRRIRKVLRGSDMGSIRVESIANIQGLEFDILIISTVRTLCDATLFDEHCGREMGFLTNPKLLNTALTRARYQVVIIGNPLALCSVGECKACWKTIMRVCEKNKTFNYKLEYNKFLQALYDDRNINSRQCSPPARASSDDITPSIKQLEPSDNDDNISLLEESDSNSKMASDPIVTTVQSVHPFPPPPYYEAITTITSTFNGSLTTSMVSYDQPYPITSRFSPILHPVVQPVHFLGMHSQWPFMVSSPFANTSGSYQNRMIVPIIHNCVYPSMPPFGTSPQMSIGYPMHANIGYMGDANAYGPPFVSKVFLPPCKNLLDLRQKISFVQNYCLHLLNKINSNSVTNDLVRKSGSESLQKLDELSQNYELCEPSVLEMSVINIEREVEKCYLFAEDQFNSFVKAHADMLSGIYPVKIAVATYKKLQKQLHNIEVFLKNEQFKCGGDERQATRLKKDLYALSFHSLLISYEMQVCQWLLPGPLTALLNVKLDFIEKSIQGAEASKEQFRYNLSLGGTSTNIVTSGQDSHPLVDSISVNNVQNDETELERNVELLKIDDQDPDVMEWFTKRRDDPYVQEYVTTNVRHFAERLPSPLPVSSGTGVSQCTDSPQPGNTSPKMD